MRDPWKVGLVTLMLGSLLAGGPLAAAGGTEVVVPYKVDEKKEAVVAFDKDGSTRWERSATKIGLGILRGVRWDADRVYVSCVDGLVALDCKTGEERWRASGMVTNFEARGDLLLTVVDGADRGCVLVARSVKDGKEAFRTMLPFYFSTSEDDGLFALGDLFLVGNDFDDKAVIVDRRGNILQTFKSCTLDFRHVGENWVILTGDEIVAISPKGDVVWKDEFAIGMSGAGGESIGLPDNTVIVYIFGENYDSGVSLIRYDPITGKVLWQKHCEALGVAHSKYFHKATVTLRGSTANVHSVGSYGEFEEVLDLETGKQLLRK